MGKNVLESTGESWKEIAQKMTNVEPTNLVRLMISRLNEVSPFAEASGILDNGCGSGSLISYILDTFGTSMPESSRILASDFSPHMLAVLEKTKQARISAGSDVWQRLELHMLDAHDLSAVPAGSMSHVTGGHVYMLLKDPRRALEETHRVLKDGGALALSCGKSSQHIKALEDAVETIKPGTQLKLLREPWASQDGVRGELTASGFSEVQTFLVESEMRYTDVEDFANTLCVMPVMQNATEGFDEAEKKQLHSELVENLKKVSSSVQGASGAVKGVSIVAIARKS